MKSFLLLFALISVSAYSQDVSFEVGEWIPFTDSRNGGLATELVRAACEESGLSPWFKYVPWRRAEHDVRVGAAFGSFPYVSTEERNAVYYFSKPLLVSKTVFAYNAARVSLPEHGIRDVADLKAYKTGIITGSGFVTDYLVANGVSVEETETVEASYRKLESNRIDILIDDLYVIKDLIRRLPNDNIRYLSVASSFPFYERTYRVMATKALDDAPEIIRKLNLGLDKIVKNGTYERILKKY